MHCRLFVMKATVATALIAAAASPLAAQISTDEAQRRLQAKLATHPATTQPATDLDRLREENRRLRERIMDLQGEITVLKASLARATAPGAGTGAATQPSVHAESPTEKALIGRWHGGDITAGTAYLLQFDPEGVYKQAFVSSKEKDSGQYRVYDENMLEMWSDKSPIDRQHNHYRLTITPQQVTLTPTMVDGVEVKSARALVLRRTE